jgi:hypothetical protein
MKMVQGIAMTPTDAMTTPATSLLDLDFLLAAEPGLLDSSPARIAAWIVGLLVVIGAAWWAAIASGAMRRKERAIAASKSPGKAKKPKDVFGEICTAQGLSPEEERQLLGGAAILKLASPSLLFVDSGLLNKLVTSGRDDAGEFRKLADRLFPPELASSEADLAELTDTPAAV